MNTRVLRILCLLLGLAGLAGFGWTFFDFVRHRDARLAAFDLNRFAREFKPARRGLDEGHLKPIDHYKPLWELEVTGRPKPVAGGSSPPPPPPPLVGPDDLVLAYVQYVEHAPESSRAYIYPRQAPASDPGRPAGGLYGAGQRFKIPGKEVEVEVVAVHLEGVDLRLAEKPDSVFTLRRKVFDVSPVAAELLHGPAAGVPPPAPPHTRMTTLDLYEVGTEDLELLEQLPEDEILAAVQVRPETADGGQRRGLRLAWIQPGSVFAGKGLEEQDIILDVNGFPATDRAELTRWLRDQRGVDTFRIRLERKGLERTITYRVPRR